MMLEIPVGTVKSRVYYSLRRLRERIQGLDPGGEA
jgi:DNA-directed RNA polymerase specialized sigma24 family protein